MRKQFNSVKKTFVEVIKAKKSVSLKTVYS